MSPQRKRLGLALAGGVLRGRAHVGVIQALEEAGIVADFVSGVSAGAIVGAAYAAGLNAAQLHDLAHDFSWLQIATPVVLNPFRQGLSRLGLVDFYNLELFLIRAFGDLTFEELPRPLAIGTTDVMTGQPVTLTSGRVALAARASSSVPGVVAPVRWRDRVLCDGGVSNNVPISILRDMGADVVVAVNIMPGLQRLPSNFIWAASNAISHMILHSSDKLDSADIVIEPDIAETSYVHPPTDALVQMGQDTAAPFIPRLQALLA
jgi:NTE family protein